MFKYTFDPKKKYYMFEKRTPGKPWWNTQFEHQKKFLADIGAPSYSPQLMHHLREFDYMIYEKPVKFVEVGGYLIPSEQFIMEEI